MTTQQLKANILGNFQTGDIPTEANFAELIGAIFHRDGKEYHVSDYGAVGDGVTRDTVAINAAIQAASDAGGGTVVFDGRKSYLLHSPNGTVTGGINLRPNVNLQGNGCTLIQDGSGDAITGRPDKGLTPTGDASDVVASDITVDLSIGDTQVTVADASGFTVGDEVALRLGDNPFDNVEARRTMWAVIVAIDSNTLTIDKAIPADLDVSEVTNANNKRVFHYPFKLENFWINGFKLRDDGDDGRLLSGIDLRWCRNFCIANITATDPENGLYQFAYCENAVCLNSEVPRSTQFGGVGATGRALNTWNCRNIRFENFYAKECQGCFFFIESYCEQISLNNFIIENNWYVKNGTEREIAAIALVGQGSVAHAHNWLITGSGREPINATEVGVPMHDSGGSGGTLYWSNLTVRTTEQIGRIALGGYVGGYLTVEDPVAQFTVYPWQLRTITQEHTYNADPSQVPTFKPPTGLVVDGYYYADNDANLQNVFIIKDGISLGGIGSADMVKGSKTRIPNQAFSYGSAYTWNKMSESGSYTLGTTAPPSAGTKIRFQWTFFDVGDSVWQPTFEAA